MTIDKDTVWKMPKEPMPMSVVQVIPVDLMGRVLVMHRTDKVRSAKNCWSFPSGMHDIGKTIFEVAQNELVEEYGLAMRRAVRLGGYENIAGDAKEEAQYHWVINVLVALVNDVSAAVNREPERHDKFDVVNVRDIGSARFLAQYKFHETFERFWTFNGVYGASLIMKFIHEIESFPLTRQWVEGSSRNP